MVVLAAVIVLAGLVLRRCSRHVRGIEVCVQNVDRQPLRSGEVAVKSSLSTRRYTIGDLAQAHRACVWVKADKEASVDVTFKTPNGTSRVIPLSGYIEPGYSGWISAEVTGEGARSVHDDIDVY